MGAATCSVPACGGRHYARGWCQKHYKRWRRHGDPLVGEGAVRPRVCSVAGCDRPVDGRGFCHGHLQRVLRTGDVQADLPFRRPRQPEECVVEGPACVEEGCDHPAVARERCANCYKAGLKAGTVTLDPDVRVVTGTGHLSHGYWKVRVPPEDEWLFPDSRHVLEHRLVMARALGRPLEPDESVHHRNGRRTDNRIDNLELWTRWQASGQRVEDKVAWAESVLARYAPHLLAVEDEG